MTCELRAKGLDESGELAKEGVDWLEGRASVCAGRAGSTSCKHRHTCRRQRDESKARARATCWSECEGGTRFDARSLGRLTQAQRKYLLECQQRQVLREQQLRSALLATSIAFARVVVGVVRLRATM